MIKGYEIMPEELERTLREEAEKKFPGDKERQDRYVYGALRKTGWKPEKQEPEKQQSQKKVHPYFRKIGRKQS